MRCIRRLSACGQDLCRYEPYICRDGRSGREMMRLAEEGIWSDDEEEEDGNEERKEKDEGDKKEGTGEGNVEMGTSE